MAVGRVLIQVLSKLKYVIRVPFVAVINALLVVLLESKNVYSAVQVLPALVMVVLLLFIDWKNLTLICSCCVFVDITVSIILFCLTAFIPEMRNVIVETESKLQLYYGLCCYLIILTILGWVGERRYLPKPVLLGILVAFSSVLGKYKYYWIIGLTFYMLGKTSGIHDYAKEPVYRTADEFRSFGVLNLIVHLYKTRHISTAFRIHWLFVVFADFLFDKNFQFGLQSFLLSIGASCYSLVQLFGMSLWLPQLSYFMLWITRAFLGWTISHTANDVEPRDLSKPLVFCIISGLNGVMDKDVMKRTFFLSIFLFITFSFFLQSTVKLVDDALKSLSMLPQNRYAGHARALTMMLFLLWFIVYTSYKFCTIFPLHMWQLVVISSNIVTIIQILSSLAVYTLFIKDSSQTSSITDLDDWVYYIASFSNSFEFLSAFMVLSYGLWNVFQDRWSVATLLIIISHTYYNVWLKARDAWEIFIARRTAATKLGSLRVATKEQLRERGDLCPICFEAMVEAKATQCGHFFHSYCLRKWLYIRSSCPLCHQDVLVNKVKED